MNSFLPRLLATITRHERYRPEFEWNNLWTHNIFRAYEYVFGRRFGIRAEASMNVRDGIVVSLTPHSTEARITFFEERVRAFFKKLLSVRLVVRQLQLATQMGKIPFGYSFSIAFDAAMANQTSNNHAYTVTGSNPGFMVYLDGDTGSPGDPTVTYNSASLTLANKIQLAGDRVTYMFYKGACATGSNTVTLGSVTFISYMGTSYSGIQASNTADSSSTHSASTNGTWTDTTTVVASNCWLVTGMYGQSTIAGSGGSSVRTDDSGVSSKAIGDSNATVGTGSQSISFSVTVGQAKVSITASFAPFVAAVVNARFLAFM